MHIPSWIRQLAKCCDPESSRYALGGVQILSDGKIAQVTATDGRCLANVYYEDDRETTPAPVSAIVDAKDFPKAPEFKHTVTYDGKAMRAAGKVIAEPKPIDRRFPRIEDVFVLREKPDGYVSVKLDAELLGKLCALSAAMNDDPTHKGITLFIKDHKSAVFATTTGINGEVARMAIMPRVVDGESKTAEFPPRPGEQPVEKPKAATPPKMKAVMHKAEQPAPPPEMLDDDAIAEAVTREPDPIGSTIVSCGPLAPVGG